MAQEPGNLSDFRTLALEQWDGLIARFFGEDRSEQLFDRSDDCTPEVVPVEWGSHPVRVRDCLQSMPGSYRLLDWSTPQGDIGRAELQEDPAGRDDDGASGVPGGARRSPSGRGIAAGHTVGGEPSASPEAVYGSVTPFCQASCRKSVRQVSGTSCSRTKGPLKCLKSILGLRSWPGDANFGGPQDRQPGEPVPHELMPVTVGGYYAVPSKS